MNISNMMKGGLACAIGAVAINTIADTAFDAQSQPLGSIAPIVLSDTNLANGPVKAYRPWFENGTWQGDLIEYTVQKNGTPFFLNIDLGRHTDSRPGCSG